MILQLKDINLNIKNNEILQNINLMVNEGEILSILGQSGAGKSSILKVITGILPQTSGNIFLKGEEISNKAIEKRNIPYMFQNPTLFPHMTVLENITFSLVVKKINKIEIEKKAKYIGEKLHIWNLRNRYPNELSGGEIQRVAMARALCANSSLILMDEPFSSLDKNLKIEMCKVIKDINKDFNTTFIIVSHDIEESLSISNSIAILGEKKILQKDTPKNIYYFPESKYVGSFLGEANYISGEVVEGKYFKCILGNFLLEDKRIIDKKFLCIRPGELIILNEEFCYKDEKIYVNEFIISHIEEGYKSSMLTLTKGKDNIIIDYSGDKNLNIGEVILVKLKNER